MKIVIQEHGKEQGIIISEPKEVTLEEGTITIDNGLNTYKLEIMDNYVNELVYRGILKALEEGRNYNVYATLYKCYITSDYDITKSRVTINE